MAKALMLIMIVKKNIQICDISWIHRGGHASAYFEPQTAEELINTL